MGPEAESPRRSAARRAVKASPWAASVVTAVLILAIGFEVHARELPEDPAAYHEQVRALAKSTIPYSVGDWFGSAVDSPPAAVEMLHPNVLENRSFVNARTGESASLLFVQCSDARDLLGHYPPICYPAHGMTLESSTERDWKVGGTVVRGMRYRLSGAGQWSATEVVVDNFMVLPSGEFGRDMASVNRVAKNRHLRQFGAAQVQVMTGGSLSDERRDEILCTLVGRIVPLLTCIQLETGQVRRD